MYSSLLSHVSDWVKRLTTTVDEAAQPPAEAHLNNGNAMHLMPSTSAGLPAGGLGSLGETGGDIVRRKRGDDSGPMALNNIVSGAAFSTTFPPLTPGGNSSLRSASPTAGSGNAADTLTMVENRTATQPPTAVEYRTATQPPTAVDSKKEARPSGAPASELQEASLEGEPVEKALLLSLIAEDLVEPQGGLRAVAESDSFEDTAGPVAAKAAPKSVADVFRRFWR